MTIGLVSLGCAKNAVDLQVMAGHLLKAGHTLAPDPDCADMILVNTCAFIESAREEAVAEIARACELKRAGRCKAVVAAGCFVQRYRAEVLKAFPDLDAVLGVDALDHIAEVVGEATRVSLPRASRSSRGSGALAASGTPRGSGTLAASGTPRGSGALAASKSTAVPPGMPKKVFDPPLPALRLTGAAFAYLKVAEGCAHRCAYCAIPAIRGKFRSRPLKSILAEARVLVKTGVKELNIIAQDPMLYGVDFRDGTNLVTLLRALDRIKGDFWVRVLYSYPSEITDAFLDWMNTSPHAVKYIDVPLQHTDPKILQAMARGSAVKATLSAAERLRAAVPGVTLRTTVMTGFPGETPATFKRMLADVKRMSFDHLGVFAFSPEEGTPAATLPRRPSLAVAERRAREVMALQKRIWSAKARTYVGKTFRALVVAPGIARLASQAPDVDGVVHLRSAAEVGAFVDVTIEKVRGFDFESK